MKRYLMCDGIHSPIQLIGIFRDGERLGFVELRNGYCWFSKYGPVL